MLPQLVNAGVTGYNLYNTGKDIYQANKNAYDPINAAQSRVDNARTADILKNSQAQTDAILSRLNQINQKTYAPTIDYAAINAQARQSAENAVNPFYTKQLNDFLSSQAARKSQEEAQAKTNVKTLEEQLKQTLEGNEITQGRTAEDVTQNIGQINQTADEFQTDTGQEFDVQRLALARAASTGGLGAQQQETALQTRNTQEKRQEQQFQQKRQEQQLFKARTFEDLARSGQLATGAKEKGVGQVNVDLANFIQNQGFETEGKKIDIENARLQRVSQEAGNQSRLLVQNWVNSIANPAQRQAAAEAYL